jgi:RND family efflux transporter MFP subunit
MRRPTASLHRRPASLSLLACGALALVAGGCGHGATESASLRPAAVDVSVVAVSAVSLPAIIEAGGVVRARTTAAVTSRILAPVRQVLVTPGTHVRAGQVLARLDDGDLAAGAARAAHGREAAAEAGIAARAQQDAARAALARAPATQRREAQAQLAAADAGARGASAGLSAATAGADGASVALSWATIVAPFGGVVTEQLIEAGNTAAPGVPLFRIEKAGGLRLEVRLDESRAALVAPGTSAEIVIDAAVPVGSSRPSPATVAATSRVTGHVTEVARAADAGGHAYLVKIDLPDGVAVPSGAFARARFAGPARRGLLVSDSAIVRRGQLTAVYVVDGERLRLRLVNLGERRGDQVEVLAGLDEGDRIVAKVTPALADGLHVRARALQAFIAAEARAAAVVAGGR